MHKQHFEFSKLSVGCGEYKHTQNLLATQEKKEKYKSENNHGIDSGAQEHNNDQV